MALILLASTLMTGCSHFLVRKLAFHPLRIPAELEVNVPGVEELWLETSDGTRIHALLLARAESRRAVLFLHGNAGHALHRLDDALRLADLGVTVLLLDYRGYGKSSGTPSEPGVYQDALAALAYLRDDLGFAESEVVILGRSIGSAIAVHVAQDRDLAGLILVTPLSSGRDVARTLGIGWLAWMAGSPFDSVSKVSAARCPVLFIHGDADRVIPLELGRRLFDAYPGERKRLLVVHDAGHNDIVQVAGTSYWRWIGDFLSSAVNDGKTAANLAATRDDGPRTADP